MAEGTTLNTNILSVISDIQKKVNFSGSILIKDEHHILAESSYGYANRADQIKIALLRDTVLHLAVSSLQLLRFVSL